LRSHPASDRICISVIAPSPCSLRNRLCHCPIPHTESASALLRPTCRIESAMGLLLHSLRIPHLGCQP
jgi:hypothetical protein